MRNIDWYHSLKHPALSPPDWLFAPVWSILYLTIFLSLIVFLKDGTVREKVVPLGLFTVQILLNFLWSPVFFGMKKIGTALIICFLLWVFILAVIISFYHYSKLSAFLLVPYFLWSTFALYLNFEIWRLNRVA